MQPTMCYVMHAKFIFLDQVFKLDWRFEINVNSYFFQFCPHDSYMTELIF